ncbi:MAG: hypothetical protein JSU01_09270 [Bacteroidetes bacterium]|nr:hypothetical protein [Bacteroidota bacterium]
MKLLGRAFIYLGIICGVILINSLFFLHRPPEVQLVFITPGFIILGFALISDDIRKRNPSRVRSRWVRGR